MRFSDWFEESWKRPDERRTPALIRLAARAGVALPTLRRALEGGQVRPSTAETLAAVTEGKVTRESIVFGVTTATDAQTTPVTETAA